MKFKKGDYVKSKEYGYVLKVLDISERILQGKFITPHPERAILQLGQVGEVGMWEGYTNFFELCEKPNTVKVVRKWQDLIGLENGKGLVIDGEGTVVSYIVRDNSVHINRIVMNKGLLSTKTYCEILKTMGFEFEYKPMRTVEEIIEEMREKEVPFVLGEFNYYVRKWQGEGEKSYFEIQWGKRGYMLGTIYLQEEDAEKYVEELNEIINQ